MARKPTSWSIKGIKEDTRNIARAAAEREEQTIGSWIEYAIREHGGQRPRDNASDQQAGAGLTPVNTERQKSDTQPSAPGLSDRTVLTIIDRELDASTSRLDHALRPMAVALLDLAERLVSVEQSPLVRNQIGSTPARRQLENAEGRGLDDRVEDDFGPAPLRQSFDEEPAERETVYASTDNDQAPSPPSHDLAPSIDSLDVPMLPVERADRAREIDRRLRALAGEVEAADSEDIAPPPPPTGSLGPSEIIIDDRGSAAKAAPDLALPMEFSESQQSGSHSGAVAAADEIAPTMPERRGRKRGKILLGITGLTALVAFGIYVFAGQIGLGPLRDNLDNRLKPAADITAEWATHIWQETERNISPLIERAMATLLGVNRPQAPEVEPQAPEVEIIMDDAVEVSPPIGPAQSARAGNDDATRESEVLDRIAETVDPVLFEDFSDIAPIVDSDPVEPAPSAPKTVPLPPAEKTVPVPEAVIAPLPEPSEPPVPVPNAAPAMKIAEAPPPPAPALPAPQPSKPTDTNQVTPLEGRLPQDAWESLKPRADSGDAQAQHDLALAYLTGVADSGTSEMAAELLRKAAIQGLSDAQYNLAVLYQTGQGVRQDDIRALLWYHSAAEQGHPKAQYNLGVIYAEGRGIPLSFGEAARWFKAAANQDMARAFYNLAVLTNEGLGVKQDKEKARELFRAAADSGDQRAIEILSGEGRAAVESGADLSGAQGLSATVAMVTEVQRELARLGFYSERIDGLLGPKTRAAIRDFERMEGMEQRGEPTSVLLEKLKRIER